MPGPTGGVSAFNLVKEYVLSPCCELSATARVIALAVADRMGRKGVCWPSYRDIASRSGISPRTVERTMEQLCTGPTPVFHRRYVGGKKRKALQYTLALTSSRQNGGFESRQNGGKTNRQDVGMSSTETESLSGENRHSVVDIPTDCRVTFRQIVGPTLSENPLREPKSNPEQSTGKSTGRNVDVVENTFEGSSAEHGNRLAGTGSATAEMHDDRRVQHQGEPNPGECRTSYCWNPAEGEFCTLCSNLRRDGFDPESFHQPAPGESQIAAALRRSIRTARRAVS